MQVQLQNFHVKFIYRVKDKVTGAKKACLCPVCGWSAFDWNTGLTGSRIGSHCLHHWAMTIDSSIYFVQWPNY